MTKLSLDPPLSPRNGHTLQVLLPCRVSDPTKQDIRSISDQATMHRGWLGDHTDFHFEDTVLERKESGEWARLKSDFGWLARDLKQSGDARGNPKKRSRVYRDPSYRGGSTEPERGDSESKAR